MENAKTEIGLRLATVISALAFLIPGLMLILSPRLFYDLIAYFPPYNQHFMGDAGSFSFGLGVGLVLAMRNPAKHRALLVAALVASIAHVFNHAYSDFVVGHEPLRHALTNTLPLAVAAMLLAWVLLTIQRNAGR